WLPFLCPPSAPASADPYALSLHDALPIWSGDLYTLWRREDFSMDAEPLEGGLWIPVADNVVDFQLGFYDLPEEGLAEDRETLAQDRKSTRLNSSHVKISYAGCRLKEKVLR